MDKIITPHGEINLPAFLPVTTFGDKYPLDQLVRPYLHRVSQCLMASYHYARQMKTRPKMPMFIDSGGFASLFEGAEIIEHEDRADIRTKEGERITPEDVLAFQEKYADIGATLDFIIPPGMDRAEAERRQSMTIRNAIFAKERCTGSLVLYASLQCWDEESAARCAEIYARAGFSGIAIGGMVPRSKNPEYIKAIVRAVHESAPQCAVHVFGCGQASLIPELIKAGASSFDSSSYVREAVEARELTKGAGIYAGIYAALARLYEINRVINSAKKPEQMFPNAHLLERIRQYDEIKSQEEGGKNHVETGNIDQRGAATQRQLEGTEGRRARGTQRHVR